MKVSEFQNEVARRADTSATKINVAETKRVLGQAFEVLAELPADEAFDIVSKSVAAAAKRNRKTAVRQGLRRSSEGPRA